MLQPKPQPALINRSTLSTLEPTMFNSKTENYQELWNAKRKEIEAKAERLDAERQLELNDALDNFQAELDAAGDWTAARWDDFTAKLVRIL